MKAHPTSPWNSLALVTLLALPLAAGELLRQGDMSAGAPVWHVPTALGDWSPIADGIAQLHPPGFGYNGPVVYQNLNVPGAAGQPVTTKARVRRLFGPLTGNSVNLAADYLTPAGQTKRIALLSPGNESLTDGEFLAVQQQVTLPADAAKLVRFLIIKTGYGEFAVDDVSLDGPGLTPGAVPAITGLTPASGPYNSAPTESLVTLTGSGFGTVSGQVRIAVAPLDQPSPFGGSGSLSVVSWTDTRVVARVAEPARSGKIWLLAGGVESDGEPMFTVTSPHFTVDPVSARLALVKGQSADVVFRVAFFNGFSTAGGIRLMPTMPVPGDPTAALFGPGGAVIRFSTASLAAGTHQGVVQSLEDKSFARFASFELTVSTVSAIKVYEWDQMGVRTELENKTVNKQGSIGLQFDVLDQTGAVLAGAGNGPSTPPVEVTTSSPQVVSVHPGNFGPELFAQENGSAVLTLRTPDGFSRTFPVMVAAPASPRVLSLGVSPPIVSNDGTEQITYGATATEGVTVGYRGFLTLVDDNIVWSDGNRAAVRTFKLQPGTPPGEYLFTAGTGGMGSTTSEQVVALRVVNSPNRGAVSGRAYPLDLSAGIQDGAMGTVEFYAADGTLAFSRSVESYFSTAYFAGFVPPGTYRVRYVPMMTMLAPQWWPNAKSFASAQDIVVAAGQVAGDRDFFLGPVGTEPVPVVIPTPTLAGDGTATFGLTTTVAGKTYVLEYVRHLGDTTWQEAARATGDGGPKTLADVASADPARFYRLRVE